MSKATASYLIASALIAAALAIYLGVTKESGEKRPTSQSIPESPKPDGEDGPIAIPAPAKPAAPTVEAPEPVPERPAVPDVLEAPTAANLVSSLERDPRNFRLDDRALRILRSMGEEAVPDLRRSLKHPAPAVRGTACWTLELLGPHAHAAVPDLIDALKDKTQQVQEAAAQALGAIGAAAAEAIPMLTELGKEYEVEPLNDIARVAVERIREALDEEEG